jgi:hypothetical protein
MTVLRFIIVSVNCADIPKSPKNNTIDINMEMCCNLASANKCSAAVSYLALLCRPWLAIYYQILHPKRTRKIIENVDVTIPNCIKDTILPCECFAGCANAPTPIHYII